MPPAVGSTLTGTVTCHPGDTSDTGHQAGDTTDTRHTTDTGHEAWHTADTRQHPCTWREAEQSEHPKMPHAAGPRACGYGPLKQSQKLEHQRAQHLPECLLRDQCPHAHPPGLGRPSWGSHLPSRHGHGVGFQEQQIPLAADVLWLLCCSPPSPGMLPLLGVRWPRRSHAPGQGIPSSQPGSPRGRSGAGGSWRDPEVPQGRARKSQLLPGLTHFLWMLQ